MDISIFRPTEVLKAGLKNYKSLPRFKPPYFDPIEESWVEARRKFKIMKGRKIHEYIGLFNVASEVIQEVVCSHRDGIILPDYLGLLVAAFSAGNRNAKLLDFDFYSKTGVAAYHKAHHSNGMPGKIVWNPNFKGKVQKNLKIWQFVPCKEFQKRVSDAFKADPQMFKRFDFTYGKRIK